MSEDAERAQWEAASRVRAQRDAEAAARAQVVTAPDEDPDDRSNRRPTRVVVAVAVVAVCIVAVAVVLVAIRHRSAQQPSWVAQLGLDRPAEGDGQATTGTAVDRFGSAGETTSPTVPAGGSTSTSVGSGGSGDGTRPPLINTSGEDFDQVWRQIEVLESWLLEHPRTDLVDDIYVPGTPPYDDLIGQLSALEGKGQSGRVDGYQILGVTVDSRPSADQVELRYADTYTDRLTLDANGAVGADQPYDGRARLWTLTLQRGDDHRWRVSATSFVSFGDVVPPAPS